MHHPISIATPTAPPTTHSISFNTSPVLTAALPVCKPGDAVPVPVPPVAPAPPVGVGPTDSAITVVALMTEGLPFGRMLVCRTTLVCEDLRALVEAWVEMGELDSVTEGETEVVVIALALPAERDEDSVSLDDGAEVLAD